MVHTTIESIIVFPENFRTNQFCQNSTILVFFSEMTGFCSTLTPFNKLKERLFAVVPKCKIFCGFTPQKIQILMITDLDFAGLIDFGNQNKRKSYILIKKY